MLEREVRPRPVPFDGLTVGLGKDDTGEKVTKDHVRITYAIEIREILPLWVQFGHMTVRSWFSYILTWEQNES